MPSCLRASHKAFTLTELLVVIGIIVVILGMSVAALNQITGTRSVSMAQNQVAAFLAVARSQALQGYGPSDPNADCGVLFYRDPQTGRSAMAMVWRHSTGSGDPDPNDRYKSWTPGVSYSVGDRVVALTLDNQAYWTGTVWQPRILAKTYQCIRATNNVRPPTAGPDLPAGPDPTSPYNGKVNADGALFYNNNWEEVIPGNIELVSGFDPQLLSPGVAAQVMIDSGSITNPPAGAYLDRYLRTGLILFDRLGRLDSQTWSISSATAAGQLLGLGVSPNTVTVVPNPGASSSPQPNTTLTSGLGMVLYDEGKFSADPSRTDVDSVFTTSSLITRANATDEQNEENWLDQNTTLLLLNRASGQLIKGE